VCVHIDSYVYITRPYICIFIDMYIYMHNVYTYMHWRPCAGTCVFVCVCGHVCVCVSVYVYTYIHVCIDDGLTHGFFCT